jgi:hypothetical protein
MNKDHRAYPWDPVNAVKRSYGWLSGENGPRDVLQRPDERGSAHKVVKVSTVNHSDDRPTITAEQIPHATSTMRVSPAEGSAYNRGMEDR